MWTRRSAIALCKRLEAAVAPHYHVALGGGNLHRGRSDHDVDIILFPHNKSRANRKGEWHLALSNAGLGRRVSRQKVLAYWKQKGGTDRKWVEVWEDERGRRVDIIYVQ